MDTGENMSLYVLTPPYQNLDSAAAFVNIISSDRSAKLEIAMPPVTFGTAAEIIGFLEKNMSGVTRMVLNVVGRNGVRDVSYDPQLKDTLEKKLPGVLQFWPNR
jgi:hypothetical protein